MKRELICIVCPSGCHLDVTARSDGTVEVAGNNCARGEEYACQEVLDPRRVVTAVVRTTSKRLPYLPVRSSSPVPKALIPRLLRELYRIELTVPTRCGAPVLRDVFGSGIDVVATRSAPGPH